MYNDVSKQYQPDTLGALCKVLNCNISVLLEIIEELPHKKAPTLMEWVLFTVDLVYEPLIRCKTILY
ncbi:helix-turn-helix domain-containing protein [Lysinibacillus mangiferihumi]